MQDSREPLENETVMGYWARIMSYDIRDEIDRSIIDEICNPGLKQLELFDVT